MIRIRQLKLSINHNEQQLIEKISKKLKIKATNFKYEIYRKSIDARKKDNISFVYTIDVILNNDNEELKTVNRIKNKDVVHTKDFSYCVKPSGQIPFKHRPIVVGSGPAGLFCALELAELGYRPIVIERGKEVNKRIEDVNSFWLTGKLNTKSNVQFGEGGAGTFSDGKLNTLVKDKNKRGRKVLKEFVNAGAPEEILYLSKPHIGTDILTKVIMNIRKKIIKLGGEFCFETQLTSININNNKIESIQLDNKDEIVPVDIVILAIGHSARDTFEMLYQKDIKMIQKAFAIGVRIEHPQDLINKAQYGQSFNNPCLGAADYKLKHQCKDGRAVYSFCMCPGGTVVAAASEENRVVTNGMSNYKRDNNNANSALVVTVTPDDFGSDNALASINFQRKWESLAYKVGGKNYNAPIQLVGDFIKGQSSKTLGNVEPSYKIGTTLTNLNECLPDYVTHNLKEGILAFDSKIRGFAMNDAVMTGVETRTSSPIRILRNEVFESNIKGLYPIGEGAGYAGGIMSAAMDGLKIAEKIAEIYKPY